jgi:hypothetical protein
MRYVALLLFAAACSRPPLTHASADASAPVAKGCEGPPKCTFFDSPEEAMRQVLRTHPRIVGVGEAHAQRGTEGVASSTKRFTEAFLPLIADGTSDLVVELWGPDPKCMKDVKRVETAQKPVTASQAETNQNEYVLLGTRAKALGVTPWLLQPSCDDFAKLADAGDDVGAMLTMVKTLTLARITKLWGPRVSAGTREPGRSDKMLVAYGGALHNDLTPPESTRAYAFGPELDRLTEHRYVELDLIVPEYVKATETWQRLPWFAAFQKLPHDRTILFEIGERSYVLVFPAIEVESPSGIRDASGTP